MTTAYTLAVAALQTAMDVYAINHDGEQPTMSQSEGAGMKWAIVYPSDVCALVKNNIPSEYVGNNFHFPHPFASFSDSMLTYALATNGVGLIAASIVALLAHSAEKNLRVQSFVMISPVLSAA